jgi:hypothetical protein
MIPTGRNPGSRQRLLGAAGRRSDDTKDRFVTKINLAPPSGTRDFLPQELLFRRTVLLAAQTVFERHGFLPMDTPAFERLETLTGKYGDEGEKLIFKILKRGDKAASGESDLALRYDLTVPTMRVVSHNRHALPRIFKRYQIGPVWRADRPARAGSASSINATSTSWAAPRRSPTSRCCWRSPACCASSSSRAS